MYLEYFNFVLWVIHGKILRLKQCNKFDADFSIVKEDQKLSVQPMFQKVGISLTKCIKTCVIVDNCQSVNFNEAAGICEGLKESTIDSQLKENPGWTHYSISEENNEIGEICRTKSPCPLHYCEDICEDPGFNCTCASPMFGGPRCDAYIGPGSSEENPMTSCKQPIEEYSRVQSGYYWLKIETGSIKVYCDMETMDGGWTMVGFVNATSDADFQTYVISTIGSPDLDGLSTIREGRFALDGDGLKTLHDLIQFTQIRVRCYKPWHQRTFHIASTNNASGFAVVNKLTDPSITGRVPACGSYIILPDDTSILSPICHDWVGPGVGSWVNTDVPFPHRLYDHFVYKGNERHVLIAMQGVIPRLECDDFHYTDISAGYRDDGTWEYFVR